MNKGTWYAIGSYTTWGLLPVYWKWLQNIPAPQLMSHRVLWSLLSLCTVIWLSRQWKDFHAAALNARILRSYVFAATLLAINWLTYIWAINNGFILETSLGYFINPLLSVAMGVVFFRERLRCWQWIAIGIAAAGVLYLTFFYGSFPWLALTLALTFGFYGLVKKTTPLRSLHGLTLEMSILFLPAMAYLIFSEMTGQSAFLHTGVILDLLLISAGPLTAIPLLMFASAAKRIPLSLVGVLQYIAPTLQFLLGVLVYNEPFSRVRLTGFGIVWVALIIFAADAILANRVQSVAVVE